jgi:hypothetical protein
MVYASTSTTSFPLLTNHAAFANEQEEDPWMKNGPTANERFDSTRTNNVSVEDGEFSNDVPVAPMVPYGSGFDEDASNESDNDELDDLLLRLGYGSVGGFV